MVLTLGPKGGLKRDKNQALKTKHEKKGGGLKWNVVKPNKRKSQQSLHGQTQWDILVYNEFQWSSFLWFLIMSSCKAKCQSRLKVIHLTIQLSARASEVCYGWSQETEDHFRAVSLAVLLSHEHRQSLPKNSWKLPGSTCCCKHHIPHFSWCTLAWLALIFSLSVYLLWNSDFCSSRVGLMSGTPAKHH